MHIGFITYKSLLYSRYFNLYFIINEYTNLGHEREILIFFGYFDDFYNTFKYAYSVIMNIFL